MNLGIIAHNSKKVLIEDFCIAYKNILAKHEVYATGTTGRRIEEATSLHVHKFLAGSIGGDKQFMEMVCLLYTSPSPRDGLLSRMPSSA